MATKKNLTKNGNGRVNQYGVKMLFPKKCHQPFHHQVQQSEKIAGMNFQTAHQHLVTLQLQRLEEKGPLKSIKIIEGLSLLVIKLYFLGGLSLTELLD